MVKFPSLAALAAFSVFLAACSSLEMPASARYFSNQPGGLPIFKVSSGLGGPALDVAKPDGGRTNSRQMNAVRAQEPPLSATPGLAEIAESAHRVDEYVFIEFKAGARVHGQPLPSQFFLLPGGFAYLVQPPR